MNPIHLLWVNEPDENRNFPRSFFLFSSFFLLFDWNELFKCINRTIIARKINQCRTAVFKHASNHIKRNKFERLMEIHVCLSTPIIIEKWTTRGGIRLNEKIDASVWMLMWFFWSMPASVVGVERCGVDSSYFRYYLNSGNFMQQNWEREYP